MTIKSTLKVAGLAFALATIGTATQAAGLVNLGTDRGGVIVNLSGNSIPAPKAASTQNTYSKSKIYADHGSQWHTLLTQIDKAPSFGTEVVSDPNYRNAGTDRGGVIRLR